VDEAGNPVDINQLQGDVQYVDEAGNPIQMDQAVQYVDENGNSVQFVDQYGNPTIYGAMLICSRGKLNLAGMFGFDEQRLKTLEVLENMTHDLYKLCGYIRTAPALDLVEALLLMNSYDFRKVQGCIDVFKASTVASIAGESDRRPMRLLKVPHLSSGNLGKYAEVEMMSSVVAESMGSVQDKDRVVV